MTRSPVAGGQGTVSSRVFGSLVRFLYPASFRREFGAPMSQAFADRLHEVRSARQYKALFAFWIRTLADLTVSGVRLRVVAFGDTLGRWRRNRREKNRMGDWMFSLVTDLRYAVRTLVKARAFTAVAVLTLALGIGANTAIFSVLNGIVLAPLSFHEPEKVVRVWPELTFSKSLLVRLEQQTGSYEALSGFSSVNLTLTGMGEPEEFRGASVSVNHFDLLGVAPAIGRTFLPEEGEPGRDRVAILSHSLWERRFGADPGVVGQTIQLVGPGGETRTVVGIMPRDFRPVMEQWRAWVPVTVDATNFPDYEGTASLTVIGRLNSGVSVEQAQSEVRSFAAGRREVGELQWVPDETIAGATVLPVLDVLVGDVRSRLFVLFAAVGLVLLIGCTNVANLLLARGTSRSREMGIRLAMGAKRSRVVRQLLTESVLLGVVGGGVGFLAAIWTISLLKVGLPPGVPRTDLISVDLKVMGFTFGLSMLASLLFGIVPALRTTRGNLGSALHDGARGASAGGGRLRLNGGLVVVETALAVVLVVGAGLMLKSFWLLRHVDPGFDTRNLVTMRVSPPSTRYSDNESLRAYYSQLFERLDATPGVVSVGLNNLLPMASGNIGLLYNVEGIPLPDGSVRPRANARTISPGYFRAMGIPVLRGRELTTADTEDGPILVNETMAGHMVPDGDVIGKRIGGFFGEAMFTVIGVVADVHQHGLDLEPRPEMYFSFYSWTNASNYLLIRTSQDAGQQIAPLQRVVWSVDEDVPVSLVRTMDDVIGISVADSRFLTQLLAGFAALALALGAIGVYGVLSYSVSQRTREIGVRMALGAPHGTVMRSALGKGLGLVAGGVVVGVLCAVAASRLLSGFLYGVSATDPLTFAAVSLFLVFVALVASYLPARRASRIDPVEALRLE